LARKFSSFNTTPVPSATALSGSSDNVTGNPVCEAISLSKPRSIEPPPAKAISDGYALLQELGALDDDNKQILIVRFKEVPAFVVISFARKTFGVSLKHTI
jgi:hypothetical protein